MNTTTVRYWLLLVGLLAVVYASFALWRRTDVQPSVDGGKDVAVAKQATDASQTMPPMSVDDFQLIDQDGQEFDTESLHGQVWVASFFFTNCPGACWRMNKALSEFHQTHPQSTARFVSITCDPDNDTPEALKTYAEHFQADPKRWTFLTGDFQEIQKIGQDAFKISVAQKEHSDRACVVDRNGQVRGRFRLTEPDQVVMLERLLAVVEAEKPNPDEAPVELDSAAPQTETDASSADAAAPIPASS